MESQMIRSHGHDQAQEPRTVGDQQQQEVGEKKSVLNKVKDRAKKVRETIKNYGHGGHDHDHDQSDEMKTPPDEHDLGKEDSEDPEIHGPPEIHGAPMYESGAGTASQTRQPEELSRPGAADERLASGDGGMKRAFHGDRGDEVNGGDHLGRTGVEGEFLETPNNTPVQSSNRRQPTFVPATTESPEQRKFNLEKPVEMEEDPTAPTANTNPTSNYQSKVTDPTGRGEEVRDITPMIESFGKLGTRDEQNRGEKQSMTAGECLPLPTGSHDQFNPRQSRPEPASSAEKVVGKMDTSESESQQEKSPNQGGYIYAITSTAASLGSSLMSRVVGSGTATQTETTRPETGMDSQAGKAKVKQSSCVKEKVAPVYEKAAGAGTAVLSKIVGPGSNQERREVDSGVGGDEKSGGGGGEGKKVQDKGMSMSSYLSKKLKPGEEDEALSEVISEKLMMKKTARDEEGSDIPVKGGMVDKLKGAAGSWFSKPSPREDWRSSNEAVVEKMGLGEEVKQVQESAGN